MNPRMTESKSVALPLGYSPLIKMGWDIRVELMTSSATNWRPNQLGQSHHVLLWQKSGALWGTRTSGPLLRRQLLYPAELTAHIICGAGDGNRTHATSLEGWDSTIELHPRVTTVIIISNDRWNVNTFLINFLIYFYRNLIGSC